MRKRVRPAKQATLKIHKLKNGLVLSSRNRGLWKMTKEEDIGEYSKPSVTFYTSKDIAISRASFYTDIVTNKCINLRLDEDDEHYVVETFAMIDDKVLNKQQAIDKAVQDDIALTLKKISELHNDIKMLKRYNQ